MQTWAIYAINERLTELKRNSLRDPEDAEIIRAHARQLQKYLQAVVDNPATQFNGTLTLNVTDVQDPETGKEHSWGIQFLGIAVGDMFVKKVGESDIFVDRDALYSCSDCVKRWCVCVLMRWR